jgi:hypothetical protein
VSNDEAQTLTAGIYRFEMNGATLTVTLDAGPFGGPSLSVSAGAPSGGPDVHVWVEGDLVLGPQCNECGRAMANHDRDECDECAPDEDEAAGPFECDADGDHEPDDEPRPGDRCKYCRRPITWNGPGMHDWALADGDE